MREYKEIKKKKKKDSISRVERNDVDKTFSIKTIDRSQHNLWLLFTQNDYDG